MHALNINFVYISVVTPEYGQHKERNIKRPIYSFNACLYPCKKINNHYKSMQTQKEEEEEKQRNASTGFMRCRDTPRTARDTAAYAPKEIKGKRMNKTYE